jgi:hypothetical protein
MFNPFEFAETNLGRAGWLLTLETLGGIALALVLANLGYASEFAILAVLAVNVITAWFIGKAAAARGKSQWLHALPALVPPVAFWMFLKLHGEDSVRRLS